MNRARFVLGLWAFLTSSLVFAQLVDPYFHVVWVTNTIKWPYNSETYGTDTFIAGNESDNEDTKILQNVLHKGLKFPTGFSFGVAGSAYQYEGNRLAPSASKPNGVGWSIWDVFSEKKSWLNPKTTNIAEIQPSSGFTQPNGKYAVMGFYPKYYKQDISLAQKLGVGFYRLSISWPRLFPKPGLTKPDPEGVKYYINLINELKKANFNILITLYHWDLPAWLYNFGDEKIAPKDKTYGWLDMRDAKDNLTLKEFQKYVAACYQMFGPFTPYFATFNEPLTFTNSAFTEGVHAPGQYGWQLLQQKNKNLYGKNFDEFLQRAPYLQAINIIKAHYLAYKTIHSLYEESPSHFKNSPQVTLVLNSEWPEPYRIRCQGKEQKCVYHPDDVKASKVNLDFMLGWWLEPIMFGQWPESMATIYEKRLSTVGISNLQDTSCLSEKGNPIPCVKDDDLTLVYYINEGGALDAITLNHYTGYFVTDLNYAKTNFSDQPKKNSVPPDQYGNTPTKVKAGWWEDQHIFVTQFRFFKNGDEGTSPGDERVFVIGNAGNRPWLRQTWFGYRKLLHYVNYYYLNGKSSFPVLQTKQGIPFTDLAIYLTENGTSIYHESQQKNLNDIPRITYLLGNLGALVQAIDGGVPVALYTYWSLTDNFEWSEGYDSRFGLVYVDYEYDFKRIPKQSFYCYQAIIKEHHLGKLPSSCLTKSVLSTRLHKNTIK